MSDSVLRSSLVLFLVLGSSSVAQPSRQQVSQDTPGDPLIRRCLADPRGVIPRYTDDEPYIARDASRPGRALVVWQTRSGAGSVIQWSHSTDAGRSWSAPRAAAINGCAGGTMPDGSRAADPWVTIGPDGRWYLSAISFVPGPDQDLLNALVVVTSSDGGRTWDPPVAIASSSKPSVSHDNLALTADPTRPGTVYATTTLIETPKADTYYGRLGFSRSLDGGKTWEPIRALTPAIDDERIGAPQVVVDPRSGRVFVVYHGRHQGRARIGVMSSEDHGSTWSSETLIAPHVRGALVHHPDDETRFVFADDIVSAAVSPADGRIVIAYADASRSRGQQYGLSMVWSVDGRRWSAPMAVSSIDEQTAWLPAVSILADGTVGVAFQSADFRPPADHRRARVQLRRFRPTGEGYAGSPAEVLDEAPLAWPGDYQSIVALDSGFLVAYGQSTDIKAVFARPRVR